MTAIEQHIATELDVRSHQVEAAVRLLDEGATVPFIARYRKEATGELDDTQLRKLQERLSYLRELEVRRAMVLKSIEEQGTLTPALRDSIVAAETKTRLEDLYRPYMPKRRTKAQIARKSGLAPLAAQLLATPQSAPEVVASGYVDADRGVADVQAALDGARQILMEDFAEDAELVGCLRAYLWEHAHLRSRVVADKAGEGTKFADYFAATESIKSVPSHRALAMFRGRKEGVLTLDLLIPQDEGLGLTEAGVCERMIGAHVGLRNTGRAADAWLAETVRWTWRVKLLSHLETELKLRLREQAEEEAIRVFGANLRDLLLAAPAGRRPTLGLDPGLRTGVKVAVVDATGKLVDTATIYPHVPRRQWVQSIAILAELAARHQVELVSIGNGTASRETDRLAAELMARHPELKLNKIMVSEAGASVYSASELAAREFPELDVSLRGAASIARRLQDPLAELVKIEPKAIGVGQYQHDVNQARLARTLEAIVEDCVNAVGVDVNTASVPLLTRVSGLGPVLAANLVSYRDAHGAFVDRASLSAVPRLGDKAFEQAAGFLRIMGGHNPLDASAVHPEAYPVVERIIATTGKAIGALMGASRFLRTLAANDYTDAHFGEPTVSDILGELEKPGRDPRPEFKAAVFREGVEGLGDLKPDMILEGVVTNVTNFGAFVDIGVHQDGLVHISALADRFVKDPHEVVKAGEVVKVKVLDIDSQRRRIALTLRLSDDSRDVPAMRAEAPSRKRPGRAGAKPVHDRVGSGPSQDSAMQQAFARLKR